MHCTRCGWRVRQRMRAAGSARLMHPVMPLLLTRAPCCPCCSCHARPRCEQAGGEHQQQNTRGCVHCRCMLTGMRVSITAAFQCSGVRQDCARVVNHPPMRCCALVPQAPASSRHHPCPR
jgi:hypothetical protein